MVQPAQRKPPDHQRFWSAHGYTLAALALALIWLWLSLGPFYQHAMGGAPASALRVPILLLAAGLFWRRSQLASPRTRVSLRLIAAAILAVVIGEVLWVNAFLGLGANPAFGLWDGFFLVYFPLMMLGLLWLPRVFNSRADAAKFVLDALIVVVGGGMFVWHFGLAPFLAVSKPLRNLPDLIGWAYPIGDMLTLVGVATVLLRLPVGAARRSHILLALALIASLLGDLVWWIMGAQSDLRLDHLAHGFWYAQAVLLVAAGESTMDRGAPVRAHSALHTSFAALPYLALFAGYGLMTWAALTGNLASVRALLVWASALTIAVVLRQAIAHRENTLLLHERERRASESRIAKLIENAADGILILDSAMQIHYLSPSAKRLLNLQAQALPLPITTLLHPDDSDGLRLKLQQLQPSVSSSSGKLMLRFLPNEQPLLLAEVTVTDQRDDPELAGIVLNLHDVTAHQQLEDQLRHDALHDALTGLPGRELFLDRVARSMNRLGQSSAQVAVAVLDIDQYRLISDSLGHASGDRLLQLVAERLQGQTRSVDGLSRISDSGFAILLEGAVDDNRFQVRIERLHAAFAHPILLEENALPITASIGLASTARHAISPADLLRNADTALALAKTQGGGQQQWFAPEQHQQVVERLALLATIPQMIEQSQFTLHLQPVVGLVDGYPIALRPRLRWRFPETAPWPLARVYEATRNNDSGLQLGEWMLHQAQREFSAITRYQTGVSHLSLLILLSGQHLRQPGLVGRVQEVLERLGLAAVNLTISITEDSITDDPKAALAALKNLRNLGVRLALAKFGGRASSLSSLHENLFDTLLLSGQLVRSLTADTRTMALVRGVIALGAGLGARVIATGVDTEQQRDLLAELGCLYGIGDALAAAMPVEHLLPWLGGRLAENH